MLKQKFLRCCTLAVALMLSAVSMVGTVQAAPAVITATAQHVDQTANAAPVDIAITCASVNVTVTASAPEHPRPGRATLTKTAYPADRDATGNEKAWSSYRRAT